LLVSSDLVTGKKTPLLLEKSNVLQFFLADGTKISVRPSGTEPKIKFYFSANTLMKDTSQFEELWRQLDERIDAVIADMKL
jgi:phosphoglucomutase